MLKGKVNNFDEAQLRFFSLLFVLSVSFQEVVPNSRLQRLSFMNSSQFYRCRFTFRPVIHFRLIFAYYVHKYGLIKKDF